MWLLFLFLLLSSLFLSFFLSFLLLARHRIRSKAIEISTYKKYKDLPRKMREWVVFLAIGAEVDICSIMMMIMIRISVSEKGKEPKKNELRTSLAYLTYLYLPNNCYKPCPVSCLHSAYISRKFKQSGQGSRDRILPYLIRQLHYLCVSVSSERSVTDRTK